MDTLDPNLTTLATSQHGMLTTAQLTTAGLSSPDLAALVTRGVLRHPGRGLYAVAGFASPDPLIWHRQLIAGAFLLYPDAVISGASALLAHGIPVWGTSLVKPRLARPRDRSGGMRAFTLRRAHDDLGRSESPWGPCVPLPLALVEHTLDNGIVPGVVSADAALNRDLVSLDALAATVTYVRSWPRSSRAKAMLRLCDGRRESVGESRTGVTLSFLGFEVTPQVTVRDDGGRFVARVDWLIVGTQIVVEFDGRIKYQDGNGVALFEEKKREDRLRALGYVVVRIIWADLDNPKLIEAKIRRALLAA